MAKEIEVKLACRDRGVLKGIFESREVAPFLKEHTRRVSLRAFYLDTPDLVLAGAGYAFRLRNEGNKWVASVKHGQEYKSGLYVRDEWEMELTHPVDGISAAFPTDIAERLTSFVGNNSFVIIFEVRVERTFALLNFPDGDRVELSSDRGEIYSYGLETPVAEIELELKFGKQERVVSLGMDLKKRYSLEEGAESKYARGLDLFKRVEPEEFIEAESLLRVIGK